MTTIRKRATSPVKWTSCIWSTEALRQKIKAAMTIWIAWKDRNGRKLVLTLEQNTKNNSSLCTKQCQFCMRPSYVYISNSGIRLWLLEILLTLYFIVCGRMLMHTPRVLGSIFMWDCSWPRERFPASGIRSLSLRAILLLIDSKQNGSQSKRKYATTKNIYI